MNITQGDASLTISDMSRAGNNQGPATKAVDHLAAIVLLEKAIAPAQVNVDTDDVNDNHIDISV